MDKIKFEGALFDYAKALITNKGRLPEYGGFLTKIESGDIRLTKPNPMALELQVGHLFFRYGFEETKACDYRCELIEVRIRCFDGCYESGELANIGKIRNELKELEKQAENESRN